MAYSPNPSMKELAERICSQVDTITKFLDSQSLQQPSFKPDAPSAIPEDKQVQAARIALIEAASDLILLAQGPSEYIRNEAFVVRITTAIFPIYTVLTLWLEKARHLCP
jgi:6-hydroxytryprostatin B O-methyltransferase